MTDVQLETSYLDGGIKTVNFFNGRVLTAEDLRDQQSGLTDRDRRIARALGDGVAAGFTVTKAGAATLAVTEGLAVNPMGDVLELSGPGVEVPLVAVTQEGAETDGGFSACAPGSATGLAGAGVYVFCVSSASAHKGGAPGVDFDSGGVAASCGPRYTIEGLAFRLVPVDVAGIAEAAGLDATDLAVLQTPESGNRRKLRNVLSHLFLGTVVIRSSSADPFGDAPLVPVDELRHDEVLTPCDVPLAILTWVDGGPAPGIEIVDRWAVRRPVVGAATPERGWHQLPGRRRQAERLASLWQFQQQLHELSLKTPLSKLVSVKAVDHFRYLPAAGLVPVAAGVPGRRAFDEDQFFAGITVAEKGHVASAKIEPLIRTSLAHPAVDLAAGEPIFLYTVRENEDLVADMGAMPFVVFSSTSIEFQGEEDLEITAVFPSGPLHPGDAIEIRGHGFGFTTGTARVFFDAIRKDPLPGSTDRKLLVIVPEEISVPAESRIVQLKAENGELNDSVSVTVVPREVELQGEIDVTWVSVEPQTPTAGKPADFEYKIKSRLNQTADIGVAATVVPDSLEGEMTLLDSEGKEIEGFEAVGVEDERTLIVHLNDLDDEKITLTVSASAGDITQSDTRTFDVGKPVEPPDDDITFEVNDFRVTTGGAGAGSWDPATSTVELAPQAVGVLDIVVAFARAGTFERTLVVDGQGWNAEFTNVVPGQFDIDAGDLQPDGIAKRPLDVALMPNAGAAATATVTLAVREQGVQQMRTKTFNLVKRM